MNEEPPSRILLLLRHGKAESSAHSDFERALVSKGVDQATLIGDYLRSQGIRPSHVLVSSAARTRQTWDTVARQLKAGDIPVTYLEELYLGGTSEVRTALAALDPSDSVVLVVGHEPTMSQLAAILADDDASDSSALAQVRIGVPTGSMSVLTSSASSWGELEDGTLTLHTLVRS